MTAPSPCRDSLPPLTDNFETTEQDDITEGTTNIDRISNQLNRVDLTEAINVDFLSDSSIETGGEGDFDLEEARVGGSSIVIIGQKLSNSSSKYCLAGIGSNNTKVCLAEKPCTIAAHSHATKVLLNPGFYLQVGKVDSSIKKIIIYSSEPLGPIELLELKPFKFFSDLVGSARSF